MRSRMDCSRRSGGSLYYLTAGVSVMVSGFLLWRGSVLGVWTYVATLAWALAESGIDGWALLPRLLGPALFGLWMLLP